jgi:hypothetical protein
MSSAALQDALAAAQQALTAGDPQTGIGAALRAVTMASEAGDDAAAAAAGTLLAHHLFATGRFEDALYHGQRALSIWQRRRDHDHVCEVLVMLASACSDLGVDDEALEFAQQAFDIARAKALAPRLNQALAMLGALHGRLGEWDRGETLLMQALSRSRDHHDEGAVLVAQNGLVALLVEMHTAMEKAGDRERAAAAALRACRYARLAMALTADQPNLFRRIIVRSNAAAALLAEGLAEEAVSMLRECRQSALAEGMRALALKAWTGEAKALVQLGRDGEAAVALREVIERLRATDHPKAQIDALALMAGVATRSGDEAQAARHHGMLQTLAARRERQAAALREALQESADRVQGALNAVDGEWLDMSLRAEVPTTH